MTAPRIPLPVHAVPLEVGGTHRASALCECKPIAHRDLNEPGRVVYVHRPTSPGARQEGESR